MAQEPLRIVLIGKTGVGKSSLANTLIGEKDAFKVCNSASSFTCHYQSVTRTINGRSIQLVDTPGIFDTRSHNTSDLSVELLKGIVACSPGPHAFLLVMKIDRYTREEQAVVELILENFSEEALRYTIVTFTQGNKLNEGQKIEEWVKGTKALNDVVRKCGRRCHVFDNRYWNDSRDEYRNNRRQTANLLDTIDQTVRENGGRYYTNAILMRVHKEIEEETEKNQKSNPRKSKQQIMEEARGKALTRATSDYPDYVGSGTLVGAFLGKLAGPLGILVGVGVVAGIVGTVKWLYDGYWSDSQDKHRNDQNKDATMKNKPPKH